MNNPNETRDYMTGITNTALKPAIRKKSILFGDNLPARIDDAAKNAALSIQNRAELTALALNQAVGLSQMEENARRLAPSGADRYKAIVDAFTLCAAIDLSAFDK